MGLAYKLLQIKRMMLFARRGGVWFLLKPAGYLRDRRDIFLKWGGV
jgi:hypothetical protein